MSPAWCALACWFFFIVATASVASAGVVTWVPSAGPADAEEAPRWRLPLAGSPHVLRRFDPPATPWGSGHRGVDLAARAGQEVYAAGPGRVGYAGTVGGRGVVTVIHGSFRTTYLPVDASVRVGRRVAPGDRLGVVEDRVAHCKPDYCLHWGLIRGSEYLDPLTLVGVGGVRLLPFWGRPAPPALSSKAPRDPSHARGADRRGEPAEGPASTPPGDAEPEGRDAEFSLVGLAAIGSGSAGVTGLALAMGALLARRRARRPASVPTGVIDLGRERDRRRRRTHARWDPDDRTPS